jgi:hypothetical protein
MHWEVIRVLCIRFPKSDWREGWCFYEREFGRNDAIPGHRTLVNLWKGGARVSYDKRDSTGSEERVFAAPRRFHWLLASFSGEAPSV